MGKRRHVSTCGITTSWAPVAHGIVHCHYFSNHARLCVHDQLHRIFSALHVVFPAAANCRHMCAQCRMQCT